MYTRHIVLSWIGRFCFLSLHHIDLTPLLNPKLCSWVEQSEAQLDWTVFLEAKRQELQRLNKAYKESLDR